MFRLQFVFCNGQSTDYALVNLSENIKFSLDRSRLGCEILIDLQQAFETVIHNILLSKLDHYGIRGKSFHWFKSYLNYRKQFVPVNGYSSSLCSVSYGVPQVL